jgi:hypothetical protein
VPAPARGKLGAPSTVSNVRTTTYKKKKGGGNEEEFRTWVASSKRSAIAREGEDVEPLTRVDVVATLTCGAAFTFDKRQGGTSRARTRNHNPRRHIPLPPSASYSNDPFFQSRNQFKPSLLYYSHINYSNLFTRGGITSR